MSAEASKNEEIREGENCGDSMTTTQIKEE